MFRDMKRGTRKGLRQIGEAATRVLEGLAKQAKRIQECRGVSGEGSGAEGVKGSGAAACNDNWFGGLYGRFTGAHSNAGASNQSADTSDDERSLPRPGISPQRVGE